jgi:hypothetical protein
MMKSIYYKAISMAGLDEHKDLYMLFLSLILLTLAMLTFVHQESIAKASHGISG